MVAIALQNRPAVAALMSRAREDAPDARALDAIVREHQPRVTRLLVRMLGPRNDLEDLVQTVFLETCRSLCRFRGESSLSTFIGGITVKVAQRAMRPTAWIRRRGPMPPEPGATDASPEQIAVGREQLRRVRLALDHISKKKRVAFLLYEIEGMTVEEIAGHTGSSVAATYAQISHARKELRVLAEKDPYLRDFLETTRGEDG